MSPREAVDALMGALGVDPDTTLGLVIGPDNVTVTSLGTPALLADGETLNTSETVFPL